MLLSLSHDGTQSFYENIWSWGVARSYLTFKYVCFNAPNLAC